MTNTIDELTGSTRLQGYQCPRSKEEFQVLESEKGGVELIICSYYHNVPSSEERRTPSCNFNQDCSQCILYEVLDNANKNRQKRIIAGVLN